MASGVGEGRDEDGAEVQLVEDVVLHEPQFWNLSTVGLQILDPDLQYEDFAHLCSILGAMHEAVRFAIGDAILQGEHLFGERSYQAFESFQLSEEAMKEYVRVAQRVPRARRRKGLSWSHHRAVAALPAPEQKEWLKRAVDDSLSHHDLRAELRGSVLRNGDQPEVQVCEGCGRPL